MIDPIIKKTLGFNEEISDKDIFNLLKKKKVKACKPCWELKYCPYGPLVEDFPLLPPIRSEAIEHHNDLIKCLENGKLLNGELLDDERKKYFIERTNNFNPNNYPITIPIEIKEMQCNIFGHICPIVYVAEDFSETEVKRRRGRYIPFDMKIRIVRRDNYTCQMCGTHLKDDEVEFDHKIPVSKGGSSEEHNIQLTCFDCNRSKSNKIL